MKRDSYYYNIGDGLLIQHRPMLHAKRLVQTWIEDELCGATTQHWGLPGVIQNEILQRYDYAAAHPGQLSRLLLPEEISSETPEYALNPAACYHCYPQLRNKDLAKEDRLYSIQASCYRYEHGGHSATPERIWNFTMHEMVMFGSHDELTSWRDTVMKKVERFARSLQIDVSLQPAYDPFFTKEGEAKAIIQKLKHLKYELVAKVGDNECALASFNLHETFFTGKECITIGLETSESGCIAFGLERWAYALIDRHGVDTKSWPAFNIEEL